MTHTCGERVSCLRQRCRRSTAGMAWAALQCRHGLLIPDVRRLRTGHFPCARYVTTAWAEFVWVAYTLEGPTTHKNRVRFSSGRTTTPRTGVDGRHRLLLTLTWVRMATTSRPLFPIADRLLVFKQNSDVCDLRVQQSDSFEVRQPHSYRRMPG